MLRFRQMLKVSGFDSQVRSAKASQAQPGEMEGKKRRQRRTGVSGGVYVCVWGEAW